MDLEELIAADIWPQTVEALHTFNQKTPGPRYLSCMSVLSEEWYGELVSAFKVEKLSGAPSGGARAQKPANVLPSSLPLLPLAAGQMQGRLKGVVPEDRVTQGSSRYMALQATSKNNMREQKEGRDRGGGQQRKGGPAESGLSGEEGSAGGRLCREGKRGRPGWGAGARRTGEALKRANKDAEGEKQ